MRVGLLGHGAIGRVVASELDAGAVPGARLSAVLQRGPRTHKSGVDSLAELVRASDVVVEAAGPSALREAATEVLGAGRDLVAVSVGGLLDIGAMEELPSSGRLILCSGAVGGLDLVRAATFAGPVRTARLTSRKKPSSLVRPWMDADLAHRLDTLVPGNDPVELFAGGVAKAVELFPNNVNVAATLALAVGDRDVVEVRVMADPSVTRTVHVIEIAGPVGDYRFEIANDPAPDNPASSAVVAYAALRTIADLRPAGHRVG